MMAFQQLLSNETKLIMNVIRSNCEISFHRTAEASGDFALHLQLMSLGVGMSRFTVHIYEPTAVQKFIVFEFDYIAPSLLVLTLPI